MYTTAITTVITSIFITKLFKIINKNASTDAIQCIDSYCLSLIFKFPSLFCLKFYCSNLSLHKFYMVSSGKKVYNLQGR